MNKKFNKGDKIYYIDTAGLRVKSHIVDEKCIEYDYGLEIFVDGKYNFIIESYIFQSEEEARKKCNNLIDIQVNVLEKQIEEYQDDLMKKINEVSTLINEKTKLMNELNKVKQQNLEYKE